jgi:hypothetical protein
MLGIAFWTGAWWPRTRQRRDEADVQVRTAKQPQNLLSSSSNLLTQVFYLTSHNLKGCTTSKFRKATRLPPGYLLSTSYTLL